MTPIAKMRGSGRKTLRALLARLERFRCVRCGQVAFDRHLVRPGVFTCRDPFFYLQ